MMADDNAQRLGRMARAAMEGTPEGIVVAQSILAEDVRFWQQGTGWLTKADKHRMWQDMAGAVANMTGTIRTLVGDGERAAMEMTVETPDGPMMVAMFCTFRDGRIIEAREYVPELPPPEAFA